LVYDFQVKSKSSFKAIVHDAPNRIPKIGIDVLLDVQHLTAVESSSSRGSDSDSDI